MPKLQIRSEYDELKIYDDAFRNYLWVKVFDDNFFATIKSHCIFYLSEFKMVSFRGQKKLESRPDWSPLRGLIQNFRRASPPLQVPPPPG